MASNLDLYNKVRQVPAEACKNFNNGSFSGTDISPMWRIKTLTEHFGICGIGWYIEEIEHWTEQVADELCTYCKIHLFIKQNGEWSKPIVGIGGSRELQMFSKGAKVSDECYKMAFTDAISVACKHLGFGADIYWQNDPTKYTATEDNGKKKPVSEPSKQTATTAPKTADAVLKMVANAKSRAELTSIWNEYPQHRTAIRSAIEAKAKEVK